MSIDFDSSTFDMGVNCGDPSALQDMGDLTFMAWINPTSFGEASFGRICQKSTISGFGFIFYVDDINADETISWLRWRGFSDSTFVGANNAISLDVWQHVAVTYQSSACKGYVNGSEISYTSNSAGSGSPPSDFLDEFVIGNQEDTGRGFDGRIEDFRVYNRVLSASEISQIAAARGRDSVWQGRVMYLPMNERSPGTTLSTDPVKDVTDNKLNGTSLYTGTVGAEGIIRSRRNR
jgi:hypothetical protein